MRTFTKLSALCLMAAGALGLSAPAMAEEVKEFTISIPDTDGTFYNSNGAEVGSNGSAAWCRQYVQPATGDQPSVTFTMQKANFKGDVDNKRFYVASNNENANITSITTDDGWYVKKVSLRLIKDSSSSAVLTYTLKGTEYAATGTGKKVEWEAASDYDAFPGMTVTVNNATGYIGDIQITVAEQVYDPELAAPSTVMVMKYDGTTDYNVVYRIPAIATVGGGEHAGRLVAMADYRFSGADIGVGTGKIDLHMSVSDDNGETWSEPIVPKNASGAEVAKGTGNKDAVDCGFGDPALLADRESGELYMMSCAGFPGFAACTPSNPQNMTCWKSEDGGETWTDWREITTEVTDLFKDCKYGPIGAMFIGSGRIMQSARIKVGSHYRIYAVLSGKNAQGNVCNWVLYSDYFGDAGTWKVLGDPNLPPRTSEGDEPKAEELPDGSVIFTGRRSGGRAWNVFHYTNVETGAGYWDGMMQTALCGISTNACDGDILLLPAKRVSDGQIHYLALHSLPLAPGSRSNVGIFWKELDQPEDVVNTAGIANNWDGSYQLRNIGSAYSSMSVMKTGDIAFLTEDVTTGKSFSITYSTVSIKKITSGAYVKLEEGDQAPALDYPVISDAALDLMVANANIDPECDDYLSFQSDLAAFKANPTYESYAKVHYWLNALKEAYVGNYVGKYTQDARKAINDAQAAYDADPSADNLKHLENCKTYGKRISFADGQDFTFQNKVQVNGADRFLGVTGTQLYTTTSCDEANYFTILAGSGLGQWTLQHKSTGKYVSTCSDADNQPYQVVDSKDDAYDVVLRLDLTEAPWAVIETTDGTHSSKPALHMMMDGSKIVRWYSAQDKSHWLIAPVDAEACVTPDYLEHNGETLVEEVEKGSSLKTGVPTDALVTLSEEGIVRIMNSVGGYSIRGLQKGQCTVEFILGPEKVTYNVTVTDPEDGIVEIGSEEGEQVIYDLQGRRVQAAPHGISIINGQKVRK